MIKTKPRHLARLVKAARERKLFQRDRFPIEVRVEAVLLYFRGLSFREVAAHMGGQFCAQSVQNWIRRFSLLHNYLGQEHPIIVVDETKLHRGKTNLGISTRLRKKGKGNGRTKVKRVIRAPPNHVLWVAINAKTMQVVSLRLSRVQTNEDCYEFLAETRHRSRTNPYIIHDRGPWYTSQPPQLGLRHEQVRGGVRSRIECWNRQLKHRLDRFWRAWTPNSSTASMEMWLRTYAVVWNLRRARAP
jgi:transposase-like protein